MHLQNLKKSLGSFALEFESREIKRGKMGYYLGYVPFVDLCPFFRSCTIFLIIAPQKCAHAVCLLQMQLHQNFGRVGLGMNQTHPWSSKYMGMFDSRNALVLDKLVSYSPPSLNIILQLVLHQLISSLKPKKMVISFQRPIRVISNDGDFRLSC